MLVHELSLVQSGKDEVNKHFYSEDRMLVHELSLVQCGPA